METQRRGEDQGELPIFRATFISELTEIINALPKHTPDAHFAALQEQVAKTLLENPIETVKALEYFVASQQENRKLPAKVRGFYEEFMTDEKVALEDNEHTKLGVIMGLKGALNLTGEVKG